jgi:hypothetical protein
LINDPVNNLEGEMDHLNKDDLKERLIVAEKVMKSLFQRNKELEEKGCSEQKTQASNSDNVLICSNCQGNPVDKKLQQRIKELELELSLKPTQIGSNVADNAPQSYKDYMEARL